jgi:cobalt-zinc-cadmium efflux system outer membrane protein
MMRRHVGMALLACLSAGAQAQGAAPVRAETALTLQAAEARMFAGNRDIALARRAVEQAAADTMIAGQKPNPQLGVVIQNINRNRGVGAGTLRDKTVDTIVGISQTIERGGKAELRVAAAQSMVAAASAELGEVARTQLLALRSVYHDLLAAQERRAGAEETAQLFERSVEAASLRLKAGDLAAADVSRIRVDAARARNEVTLAGADLARARLSVAVLMAAESEAAGLRAASPWPATGESGPAEQDLLERRPDVRAAAARVEAADRVRELARSLRTRDVTVSAQFEHYPASEANSAGSGNSFGVGFAVPLFLRHSYEGETARAQADWYAARDAYDRTVALARAEITRARGDVAAARERRVRIETELQPQAEKSAAAAEFAFRNGAIGVMDLLDARRTLRAIQIEAVAARAEHARALAALRAGVEELPAGNLVPPDSAIPKDR